MPDLVFIKATEAFNRIGARKQDGSPYESVRGLSVSAEGHFFRFWENDIVRHTETEMELYRPPDEHRWRDKRGGRAFYAALKKAMETQEPVFVTINHSGGHLADGTAITEGAAPVLTPKGDAAPGLVLFVNPQSSELRVRIDLTGERASNQPGPFVDQFQVREPNVEAPVERSERTGTVYSRSPEIRRMVLRRAFGHCERCGVLGFQTDKGLYLETHHVVPLSESGRDATGNMVALCPNCHRKAHFSLERGSLRTELLLWLQPESCKIVHE